MSKREELQNCKKVVKVILEDDPKTRNSDSLLYLKVLQFYCDFYKCADLEKLTVRDLFENIKLYKFPVYETVRRSRQKLQEEHPELRASSKVTQTRKENEAVFREFARGD